MDRPGHITPLAATYTLQTLTPMAAGWRVVYWDGTRHTAEAVYLLGLITAPSVGDPPLVGTFAYAPTTSWEYCEGRADYCGLLPPGRDLAWYEAQDPHGHIPVPASMQQEEQG